MDKKKDIKYNSDVTKEELERLDESHLHNDGGDDEQLRDRKRPVDFEGKNLDVPGRELPENRDPEDLKDEENQLYSTPNNEE